jgi:hypothetical protein
MRSFHRLILVAVAGVCIVGFLSGCSKAPDQELAAAKAAIKAAQDAEVDKYMPVNFQNIQKALASAEAEIELQKSSFILSRSYTKAKQFLKNVTDLATQVTAEIPQAKADMKAQIEENLASAQQVAKELRNDIKKAPRSKGKEVLAQMAANLDAAEIARDQAATEFAAGNILDARKKLGEAQKLLKKVNDGLSSSGTDGLM